MKRKDSAGTGRSGLDHPQVPRGARIYWALISAAIVGYGIYGVIVNDLVVPAGRYGSEPAHLHAPATVVALAAALCFSVAIRAAVLDFFIRFEHDARFRLRARTFGLIIISFAVFFAALVMQVRSEGALLG